jgi:CO/xanthine dehydrogenase FAD-binding subunit
VHIDEIAAPKSLQEAIAVLKRRPNAIPWAGGTLIQTTTIGMDSERPASILDLGGIAELTLINRSDRYLELGACVTLSAILSLPKSLSLEPLRGAAALIGTATVRNLATIGGNIGSRESFMTCFSALACLDASLELRDANGSRWSGIHALIDDENRPRFPKSTLLTRIRIPTSSWDATAIHRLGEAPRGEAYPASFAAAARFEKGTISELRLVAAGARIVRDRELEASLIGKRLPLGSKDIEETQSKAYQKALDIGFDEAAADHYGAYVAAFLSDVQEEGR